MRGRSGDSDAPELRDAAADEDIPVPMEIVVATVRRGAQACSIGLVGSGQRVVQSVSTADFRDNAHTWKTHTHTCTPLYCFASFTRSTVQCACSHPSDIAPETQACGLCSTPKLLYLTHSNWQDGSNSTIVPVTESAIALPGEIDPDAAKSLG